MGMIFLSYSMRKEIINCKDVSSFGQTFLLLLRLFLVSFYILKDGQLFILTSGEDQLLKFGLLMFLLSQDRKSVV